MKGFASLILGSLTIIILLFTPGNAAFAAEPDDPGHCGCEVSLITGAERNKIVANLLKSDVFKEVSVALKEDGFKWSGAGDIEIIQNHSHGDIIMVGVMYSNVTGANVAYGYVYLPEGKFAPLGIAPN
jgi:hypothetical protein